MQVAGGADHALAARIDARGPRRPPARTSGSGSAKRAVGACGQQRLELGPDLAGAQVLHHRQRRQLRALGRRAAGRCGPAARDSASLTPPSVSRAQAARSSGSTASAAPPWPAPRPPPAAPPASGARSRSWAITGPIARADLVVHLPAAQRAGRGRDRRAGQRPDQGPGLLLAACRPRRPAPPAGGRRTAPPAPGARAASPRWPRAEMAWATFSESPSPSARTSVRQVGGRRLRPARPAAGEQPPSSGHSRPPAPATTAVFIASGPGVLHGLLRRLDQRRGTWARCSCRRPRGRSSRPPSWRCRG